MDYMQMLKKIKSDEKFQNLYKGFKRSISRGTILEFIKKRILAPNNIQYLDGDYYLDIIDLKNKKAYIFAYLDIANLDKYSAYSILKGSMRRLRKALKNNRVFGISKNKNVIFVISKSALFCIYYDKKLKKHTILFFVNKKGKFGLDDYSFAKFLTELAKIGLYKKNE